MPNWQNPPVKEADDAYVQVMSDLSEIVSRHNAPAFEEITGLTMLQMVKHATRAAAHYLTTIDSTKGLQVEDLVQVYCLGFVIGTKYGQKQTTSE